MNLMEMNKALQWLRDKYAVKADGTLVASAPDSIGADASLKLENGTSAALLPWRPERRFIELKKLIDGKTLEGVSTLRFAAMSAEQSLEKLLYRELDLCEYLGESPIVSTFAVISGKTANVIVKLAGHRLRPRGGHAGAAIVDLPVHRERGKTLYRHRHGTLRLLQRGDSSDPRGI